MSRNSSLAQRERCMTASIVIAALAPPALWREFQSFWCLTALQVPLLVSGTAAIAVLLVLMAMPLTRPCVIERPDYPLQTLSSFLQIEKHNLLPKVISPGVRARKAVEDVSTAIVQTATPLPKKLLFVADRANRLIYVIDLEQSFQLGDTSGAVLIEFAPFDENRVPLTARPLGVAAASLGFLPTTSTVRIFISFDDQTIYAYDLDLTTRAFSFLRKGILPEAAKRLDAYAVDLLAYVTGTDSKIHIVTGDTFAPWPKRPSFEVKRPSVLPEINYAYDGISFAPFNVHYGGRLWTLDAKGDPMIPPGTI